VSVLDTPATPTRVRVAPVDATALPVASREHERKVIAECLIVAALLLGWVVAYLLVLSSFEANHAQKQLYSQLRTDLALGEAPTEAPIAEGRPIATIAIPRVGIDDLVVVEGTRPADLAQGPGHLAGSVLPGQVGTSMLAGRRLTFGGPFRRIAELAGGDVVSVRTVQGLFSYRVTGVRRPGDPLPTALAADGARLTLVTADGNGPLSASRTVYVDATLEGKAQPAGAVAAKDMQGVFFARDASVGTLALLALSVQLVIAALVWAVWAARRWSLLAAWITGLPVVLAALWLASSVGSRLLPNLV
jgi:sortase A